MARVLFGLELGGGLGHLRPCADLGNALARRGHEVGFAMSELHDPRSLPFHGPPAIFRVPVGRSPTAMRARPASYAEVLLGTGYDRAEALQPVAQAWHAALAEFRPDLLVADFAPTAMLAARALGIPCVNYGMGFTVPPRVDPLPSFRFDEPVEPDRIPGANATALDTVNGVLRGWDAAPLERLSQLLECEEEFLCTFPELDHYGNRPASGYWGPRFEIESGARRAWPAGRGRRIFVYLHTVLRQLDTVIALLAAVPHRVIAVIPGLDEARRARLAGPLRQVSSEPVRLEPLLADCDAAITHGGQLTAGLAVLGIPQLVLPLHFEQYITATRIRQARCGLWLGPAAGPAQIAAAMREILGNPAHAAGARELSRLYPAFSLREQRRRMVVRIEEILARRSPRAPILRPTSGKEPAS